MKIYRKCKALVGHQNGQGYCLDSPGHNWGSYPKLGKFTGKKSVQTYTQADSYISQDIQQSQDSF